MIFFIKKIIFKVMEFGLGLRTFFTLETKNPIFVNFRLNEEEVERVRKLLPHGFELQKLRFSSTEKHPHYWVSYNLYEIGYPIKPLRRIHKSRCEINTFVRDSKGRRGVFVMGGSPYVGKESRRSIIGMLSDVAERLVTIIYGSGKLTKLKYDVTQDAVRIEFAHGSNRVKLIQPMRAGLPTEHLSSDYCEFNNISIFNSGRSYDYIFVDSAFNAAMFQRVEGLGIGPSEFFGPLVNRKPDVILLHRGSVHYLVDAFNRAQ